MLSDVFAGALGQLLGEILGESLERKLDRRMMLRELAAAVTRAEERFAREVLPHLAGQWEDKYEDLWWPERLRARRPANASGGAMAAAS